MAKTYIDTVKYLIYADVNVDGIVDKPDVVGAIFGQTEGLLGEELDLRDLQKNGRIGRIEVDLKPKGGKTRGEIKIPSSLDMVETCIIAAAIETVERVGPCEANIKTSNIEDTRNIKRDQLINRSKGLLRHLINTELPESQEISDMVREEVKAAEITTYGKDKLPAGPGISRAEEIILVEGRADVVNLLKKDLSSVVGIGGAKVPPTMAKLTKEKETTVFLDGDRGGDMILRELINAGADIDFLARAPAGKEVEELTRKEVMKCLQTKVPVEQEAKGYSPIPSYRNTVMNVHEQKAPQQPSERPSPSGGRRRKRESILEKVEREAAKMKASVKEEGEMRTKQETTPPKEREKKEEKKGEEKKTGEKEAAAPSPAPEKKKLSKEELENELKELSKTLKARFYDEDYKMIKELPVREVIKSLEEVKGIHAIVFDGIVTQRLVDLAESKGVKVLVGGKMGNVSKKPTKLELVIPSSKK